MAYRDRETLRQQFVFDNMSVAKLATMHGIPKATIHRWAKDGDWPRWRKEAVKGRLKDVRKAADLTGKHSSEECFKRTMLSMVDLQEQLAERVAEINGLPIIEESPHNTRMAHTVKLVGAAIDLSREFRALFGWGVEDRSDGDEDFIRWAQEREEAAEMRH